MKRTFTSLHRLFVEAGMGDKWGLVEDHLTYWIFREEIVSELVTDVTDEDELFLVVGEAFGELPTRKRVYDARRFREWQPTCFLAAFHARYREPCGKLGRKLRSEVGQALGEAYGSRRYWGGFMHDAIEAMLTAYVKLLLIGDDKLAEPLGDLLHLNRKTLIMDVDNGCVHAGVNPQTFLIICS